jgi:conjugative transfer signal peptidase TraF
MLAKAPELIFLFAFVSSVVLGLRAHAPLIAFNGSRSAPIGFYFLSKRNVHPGDLVLTRLPEPIQRLITTRGYLPSPMPVLKKVVAVVGDRFCRFGTVVSLNEAVVATALLEDFAGRELPRWQGCKVLADNEVALLMPPPRSFDSRYFGPIFRDQIISVATPIWTWEGDAAADP